ncbi:hypothetical protein Ahy_B03g062064 [Arachis hypogaea]|uniref:MULE transposase domain-containing protein n=1 Tax=Arachis hypogaea TaxID=3818 RepID=A0A444ZSZ5_ARAHY|nr:hypothetical protein Ahy_B03g062064 [Arachis hypogaea]
MEGTANLVVYRDGEIIHNTHEGVRFVCQNPFLFVVPCMMTLMELQNGLCQSMENGTLMRVSKILYRNSVIVFGGLIQFDTMPITDEASMQNMFQIHRQTQMRHPQIELYVEFETVVVVPVQNDIDIDDDRVAVYEGMNSDIEEDFKATYEVGDEDEDGDVGVKAAAENVVVHPSSSQLIYVPLFMRELDLDAMHAPEFPEYANIGVADPEDGDFWIGMEYSSRKSVVTIIRSFTISIGVDYDVYEFEAQTFYAKCKIYNGRHTCTIGMISQDHFKLDSDTVAEAIRPLVETNPSIKMKSIIAEVQSRFNYIISYRKAWLAKQKSIAKVFVAVAQDGNQNIVPIAFALVEGETADAWHFFLRNLRMYVVRKDGVGMISDRHESIRATDIQEWWRSTISTIRGWKSEARHIPGGAMPLDSDIGYWHSTRDIDGAI